MAADYGYLAELQDKIIYDFEWQKMRVGFLGTWRAHNTAMQNLATLREYVMGADDDVERARRLYRVYNLIDAVILSYKSHPPTTADTWEIMNLEILRTQRLHNPMLENSDQPYGEWDWDTAEVQVLRAALYDKLSVKKVLQNLNKRLNSKRQNRVHLHFDNHTPESLIRYIRILEGALA